MTKQQSLSFGVVAILVDNELNASSMNPGSQAKVADHFRMRDLFGRGTMDLMYS